MTWEATTLEDLAWWVNPTLPLKRDWDIVERYKSGQTLAAIGIVYGITRERVRQILKKNGITRMDGGQTISIFKSTPDRIEAQNKGDLYT